MAEWRKRAEITGDVVYFLYASNVQEAAQNEVYVWDIDKTYLDSSIDNFRGLLRTFFEKAFQKRNVPGTSTLVRALRNAWKDTHPGQNDVPIYFITASPPQLEGRIHQKLNLDGIYPFGIFCKDNLRNLRPSRMSRLRQQVGYKIQALLQLRMHLADNVRQLMWGDDSETDAIIYSLYSDICARRHEPSALQEILESLLVSGKQIELIFRMQKEIPLHDPVEKIYINLALDTDADYYLKFGRRVVPTFNSFQVALDLFQDGRLSSEQVLLVGIDLLRNYGYTPEQLSQSLDELVRRPLLAKETLEKILPILIKQKLVPADYHVSTPAKGVLSRIGARILELDGNHEPWIPSSIEYLRDYR